MTAAPATHHKPTFPLPATRYPLPANFRPPQRAKSFNPCVSKRTSSSRLVPRLVNFGRGRSEGRGRLHSVR